MQTELPIVVGNGVSFESVRSRTWKIEMSKYHMRKFNLHFTGEECLVNAMYGGMETVVGFCKNRMKDINAPCGQNSVFLL